MVYMQWRHISMLVTSQLPIQTTKFAIIAFNVPLCPPLWKRFGHTCQGCTTFCYCRPHYFYLYEVRPPM